VRGRRDKIKVGSECLKRDEMRQHLLDKLVSGRSIEALTSRQHMYTPTISRGKLLV